MSSHILTNVEEKPNTASLDELPYFPEKYPGKVCCLCNLGERSALGQGVMFQLKVPTDFKEKNTPYLSNDTEKEQNMLRKLKWLKSKTVCNGESQYELDKIGYSDIVNASLFLDDEFVYVHRMCIMWSMRKMQVSDTEIFQFLSQLSEFLEQKCSFCGQYGASITCKMNCRQIHHWPCATAAGCLLILESFTVFCTEHLSQVPLICSDNNVECLTCSSLGDLSKMVMCCSCGDHFHSTCIGLVNLPDTRAGWSCARCTKCQICRQQDSIDVKYVKCEQCQKMYHASCLRPVISSIPKYGWKCNRCRVCTDCGSRTPGGGSSSRWHSHYTICDSCYQQRNKGFSCPICQKAYRAAAYKEMVKCSWCHKFVHSTCDEEADLAAYHKKKEFNPDYDYVCPNCKTNSTVPQLKTEPERSIAEAQAAEHFNVKDGDTDPLDGKPCGEISNEDPLKLPSTKKKVCLTNMRGKGGKFVLHRVGSMSQMGKKRSSRGKGRQLVLQSGSSERYISRNLDTDFSSDKKMLLCSARDKYSLTQDICVMCGSVGSESDAVLITCAQCSQCYHPYCAGVKPSRGILQKGWRCLDCTVCEGCGKKNDEARLLLCDECDISYHIYCVNPPLDAVPHGNWKCSFCTLCQKCGRNPTEKVDHNDAQQQSPECAPCASQNNCTVCTKAYVDGETIIQCEQCSHWSHYLCDSINTQHKIEHYENNIYKCFKCRASVTQPQPIAASDNSLNASKLVPDVSQESKSVISTDRTILLANDLLESTEAIHWIDGVCLSENGLNMIKSLSTEIKRKRKMRQPIGHKDGQMDAGGSDEVPSDKYKDGMIWDRAESALPEGFSISTNDDGVHVLRKKRQRNLQKLGIGGFSVRNRAFKKDNEDTIDPLNAMLVADKKKKIIRKKQKNKLIEAYPPYLQEAFFGKPLLESGDAVVYDSDTSDEIDTTMKIFFTNVNNKKSEEETNVSNKSPVKSLRRPKPEKLLSLPENKNIFGDQFAMPTHSNDDLVSEAALFDTSMTDISRNGATNNIHTLDPLTAQGIAGLDVNHHNMNLMGATDNMKPQISEQTVFVENYAVPSQLTQDQKFHNKMFLPANVNAKAAQLHYQPKVQTMPTQMSMQNDKRVVEEPKPNEPSTEGMNVGTQKTAEKMRKDEDLGLMATISAVLYANTEHANLKELYPNWNDRCKQILKRWRSLCNEKKAPFLQKAKDNRSALRQRREQCKISQPAVAKTEKPDDNRAWKSQTCKPKEEQTNMFGNYNGISYDAPCFMGSTLHPPNSHPTTPILNENLVVKSTIQRNPMQPTASPSLKISSVEQRMELNPTSYGTEPVGDKKLRNLLQKTNSEAMLMTSNSEYFMQSDVLRLGLLQNAPITQNNPMLSMSGKPQHSEIRSLEQDGKNPLDSIKMSESQEGISSSTVELENVGFGDILGGFGEGDDDDLLKSLTSEIGEDFNILEYADPELDVNVLNTLDFEDTEKNST
ncbi:histone-lysine N-methyltransferase 2C [Drosophila sulfurigaster albostrigata]|uniref:histone-lysine N-methyltransferase 2C n=1 Tax=Drosophila sulfurigaster albostrigata TaxID=89887 RepID=UPI002D21CB6F|nr:histone-lysine N-methyltransferase 2C [Drosophila sulfurigaster albostrigata]